MLYRVGFAIAVAAAFAGCGRDAAIRCESPESYSSGVERAPIRIPGDLSVPDETDALRIPPEERVAGASSSAGNRPCLESPPDFFEGMSEAAPTP